MSEQPLIALVMPHRDGTAKIGAVRAFDRASRRGVNRLELQKGHSCLTFNFNLLWCEVLNARQRYPITHFAMIHNDVCPDEDQPGGLGWLDILLDEMTAAGTNLISTVVPIKNPAGLTSTAVDTPGNPWVARRLTMREVYDLPPTFTAPAIGPGVRLLANTGLWVCRFDVPWIESLSFRQQDRIVPLRRPDGSTEWTARMNPEDWDFSRQWQNYGGTVAITRKVGLFHEFPAYHNRAPWGDMVIDLPYQDYLTKIVGTGQNG